MRTLIVDNHDSFTFNLFHHIAEVNGREPVVIVNGDPDWHIDRLREFDNVVISPGPGNPGRRTDFGICQEIIESTDLPLLGICLGHQGIGLQHGATVSRSPEPRHGRVSPVLHGGEGLFAGLPSPLEVVRYHSLAVTDLPAELEPTAWTPDGILMALQHRERPQWGVQFHPESICTQYGRELLANFAELSRAHRPVRTSRPTRPSAPVAARPVDDVRELRVVVQRLPTRWDAEVAYDRLFGESDHAFWLDSSRADDDAGRFSVLGDASGPLARVARADVWSGTVTVESEGSTQVVAGEFLDWIDRDLRGTRTDIPELPFGFTLGWVGYLGYELKGECGGDLRHRSEEPDATMVFADRAVVLDHATQTSYLLALAEPDAERGTEAEAREWLATTAERLGELVGVRPAPPGEDMPLADIQLRHDRDAYLELIDACQEEIAAGETYEVCLTNIAEVTADIDPWQAYRLLRHAHPAPFAALLRFGELSVLSTSPERFVRVSAGGSAESKPIKGTRPRGETPQQDAELVAGLLHDEKDRAENLMIVDVVRNDLGRCAETGTVTVDRLFSVESYATVHQLVSTVRAQLRPGHSAVDCVRASFPGGSMTGAPKVRTMQIIDQLEGGPRGVYSGGIGYFSLSGAADLSIVIRTAVITPGRMRYGVGGAIIALSDPAAEFEETAVKSAPLLALSGGRFPGREAAATV
ncbi:aminodeoxychorismate synthase component I [Streptomyces sp. NPDC051322]|uniref:aminodeoxychorismate synthase component I n=1 Tax=Streptomyces sp. NPDC051322 TaxID=3154645 RepID=UPI0034508042